MKKQNLKRKQIKVTNIGTDKWYNSKSKQISEVVIK